MGGHTKKISTAPQETAGVRTDVENFLRGAGPGKISGGTAPGTASVDQLGGANSPFMQNILKQLTPLFDQQRAETLAAAKESAGNLTGSGLGNTIGTAVNRSLGAQQAQLADFAQQGLQLEMQRQQGDANRRFQGQQNDAQRFLQLLHLDDQLAQPDSVVVGSVLGQLADLVRRAQRGADSAAGICRADGAWSGSLRTPR